MSAIIRKIDWSTVSELDEAGIERFRERLAHLEKAEATPSQLAAIERDKERVRAARKTP